MKRTKLLSLCLAIVAITSLFFVGCGASKYTVTYSSQSTEMGIVYCIDEDGKTVSNGEEVTPDMDENISDMEKYDIVEGWYDVVDGEGLQMYLKQDGKVLIQGDQVKHETTFKCDGNMITIEDQTFLIDFDAMTVKLVANTEYDGEITLQ